MKLWVTVANTNRCRIYDYQKQDKKLTLVKELDHPESKLKGIDLVSDRPGDYGAPTKSMRGSYQSYENHDPKKIEIDNFSREIALELDKGRRSNSYDELILCAEPRMNGLIHQHLNKHVIDCISHNVQKDYNHAPDHEISKIIQEILKPPFLKND